MKIVLMSANRTGSLVGRELLNRGEQVSGIFTLPTQFEISYSKKPVKIATYAPLQELAAKHNIPVVTVRGKMARYEQALRDMQPDLVLVCGWYFMIPEGLRKIPPLGTIGLHPSLLPKYRGGAPLSWAMINGEKETGISCFYFDKQTDGGAILQQEKVAILPEDTIETLYDKINQAACAIVRDLMPRFHRGQVPGQIQDEAQATYFPQRSPEDGIIDWGRPSRAIYDWVRAQTAPYPGAYTYLNGKKLTVWSAKMAEKPNNTVPSMEGSVLRVLPKGVEVLTGDGSIFIEEVQSNGQRVPANTVLSRVGLKLGNGSRGTSVLPQRPEGLEDIPTDALAPRRTLVSVIVPVYNEESNVSVFYEELNKSLRAMDAVDWEILFVDDGSSDRTVDRIRDLRAADARVKALKLSRNFGSHAAIRAGFGHCAGAAAVVMSVDLQDPPGIVREFLREWQRGNEIVWGARRTRRDPFFKKLLANAFYWVCRKIALPSMPAGGIDLGFFDRRVIDEVLKTSGKNMYLFTTILNLGFRQAMVPYDRAERKRGTSKWPLGKRLKAAVDILVCYSYVPIRAMTAIGALALALSVVYGLYVVGGKLFFGWGDAGWPSIMVAILFLGGVQLIMLGILGEYIWRIAEDVKVKPDFIVTETLGVAGEKTGK